MQAKALPGFRDFYPEDAALRNHIIDTWRAVATRYGFEEYDGPPLEPLELYTQKSGEEIVGQLYHFEDKGGREVALRPEMTPTLARMVAARASALKKPIRWFSLPQLFRYERQQRGRLREHFQFNMDLIGAPGPLADAEIIAAAIDVVRDLGFTAKDIQARISDRRVIAALLAGGGVAEAQLPAAYAAIDKIERESQGNLSKELKAAGLSAQAVDSVFSAGSIRGLDDVQSALARVEGGSEVGAPLVQCVMALDSMELGDFVAIDLSIVRGLAYYTGIVFELFDVGRSLRAICGGGRYDGLLDALGRVDLPAVGFGMGDVVLAELLRAQGDFPQRGEGLDAFLAAVTSEDVPEVLRLAHTLRDGGVRVEYSLKTQAVAKQLKLAAARPAKKAVVIGPNEREMGEAVVRDLHTGTEERVSLSTLENGYQWSSDP
jgi:histidyl-tRNA synthetase